MNNAYEPQPPSKSRWQSRWRRATSTFRTPNPGDADFDPSRPKYYVLDMFPYPSGAGLHVGHPLGYIGTDVIARQASGWRGSTSSIPMGYDAFGLPAEQYAIQTGQPPGRDHRERNIETFRRQLELDRPLLRLGRASCRRADPGLLPLDPVDLLDRLYRRGPGLPGRGPGVVVRGAQDRARERGGHQRALGAGGPSRASGGRFASGC